MKRLFPAPWLSLALWVLWLLLNLSISPGNLLLGALLGFLAPLLMAPLRPQPISLRRPGVILRLFLLVGRDVIVSNLQVAWGVLTCGTRPPRSPSSRSPGPAQPQRPCRAVDDYHGDPRHHLVRTGAGP